MTRGSTGYATDGGEWSPTRVLAAVFGSDPATAGEMDREQARESFDALLDGSVPAAAAGAYLVANQWKPNSPAEIAAFLDAMVEGSVRESSPILDPVDVPAYGGVTQTALLGVAAGVVASAAGAPLAVHGGRAVGSRHTNEDVLDALGLTTDWSPDQSASMLDENWFGYYTRSSCNDAVAELQAIREAVGMGTPLDRVERFANPSGADRLLVPVSAGDASECVIDMIEASDTRAYDEIVFFEAIEGYDILHPGSSVHRWVGDSVEEIDLETAGIEFDAEALAVNDVVETSASLTEAVVSGEREDVMADAVVLNAGLRILAAGTEDSIDDAVTAARVAISSGEAAETLAGVRDFRSTGTKSVDW